MKPKVTLPSIIPDNDREYIVMLEALMIHADPEAEMRVDSKLEGGLIISIQPSQETFRQDLISNVLGLHRNLGIKTDFSKSTAIQKKVIFHISFS